MDHPTKRPVEERVVEAFAEDFHGKFPNHVISEEFKDMLGHYICLAAGAARTEIIESLIFFLKEYSLIDPNVPVKVIIEYLKRTDFQTKPCNRIKIEEYSALIPAPCYEAPVEIETDEPTEFYL